MPTRPASRKSRSTRTRAVGVVGCGAALLLLVAGGCGRIGYDPLPEKPPPREAGAHPHDASLASESSAPDATETAEVGTGEDAAVVEDAGDSMATMEEDADAGPESGADSACVGGAPRDYCQSIPALPAPPIIDGVLDCGPALVPITPMDWRGAAPLPSFPPDNTAELATAWRPDGLYIFMAVTTPVAIPADPASADYFGAGVELFVDSNGTFPDAPMFENPGTSQLIVPSPPYSPQDAAADICPVDASTDGPDASTDAPEDASTTGAAEGGSGDAAGEAAGPEGGSQLPSTGARGEIYRNEAALGPWTSSQFGTFPTPTGFVFEGFIVASDLGLTSWTLAAGGTIGFDVAVDVSFPTFCQVGLEGHRAGQYFLHVTTGVPDAGVDASADAAAPAPIGAPYMDTRSFCTPTLTSL